jgi:hypothetical protein
MFAEVSLVRFPCWLPQRGFFGRTISSVLTGGFGSGGYVAFLARKNRTRTWPGMMRHEL